MTRKSLATLGILLVLLVSMIGTAAAQSGDDPATIPTPEPEEELVGTKFFTHPVVQILSTYFDREVELAVDPTDPIDPEATPEPDLEDPLNESMGDLGPIGQQIAAYHEEGMGFGVLVKLYAMVEASEQACADQVEPVIDVETGEPVECVALTAEELVESFKNGTGVGTLFQEHGKPAMLGIGHVKKQVKTLEAEEAALEPDETEGVITTEDESLKGKKPMKSEKTEKVKSNNGKGPKKQP